MNSVVAEMRKRDWGRVRAIYKAGLETGLAAFMTKPPTWAQWDAGHLKLGRLIARDDDGAVVGWAALAPVPDT